ncbi:hypothetical protein [Candidatus Liberibacter americanus]|uniref:Uncharacterized protein n=1 Tax=Candidatus Liberibacter americanus str. Sao Paulo TaxID=1261131 RepID=U6B5L2_9HYPH|nr:hypothetical protein [Candidatus Liberibacter americanus]AHA28083.1 hypothetical protein lam_737 [Candidatus Liberibacter americanus str. Sao Paulo]
MKINNILITATFMASILLSGCDLLRCKTESDSDYEIEIESTDVDDSCNCKSSEYCSVCEIKIEMISK